MTTQPWFGAWPPDLKGEVMADDRRKQQDRSQQHAFWATIVVIALLGCIFLQLEHSFYHHLGAAFLIAALLGSSVDVFLRKRLLRDAVEAALGSSLPDALKEELRWIYEQRVLVRQSWNVTLDHDKENHLVTVRSMVTRKITNESGKKRDVIFSGGITEWFNGRHESQLTSAGYILDGKKTLCDPHPVEIGITYGSPSQKIALHPDQTLEWFFSHESYLPDTAMEYLTHRYPIIDAEVVVHVPDSLVASVTYAQRDKYDEDCPAESGVLVRSLNGVLLPHQNIIIHWYVFCSCCSASA